jgi:ABC-2 type transport system ATP-binding protein
VTEPMIEVEALSKYYGSARALHDVSFTVAKGEVAALLGANGSGKTTTMRILAGYLQGTSGRARVAGYDVASQSMAARRQVGYLPETTPVHTDMTVTDDLLFAGRLHGLGGTDLTRRVDEVLSACRIAHHAKTRVGKLSKGYRQRLGIARAILHEPAVLILDEPTIGLDPAQIAETRSLIRALARSSTILLSTHILAEIDALCGRMIILHGGAVVAAGTPAELAAALGEGQRVEMEIAGGPGNDAADVLRAIPGAVSVSQRSGERGAIAYSLTTAAGCDLRQRIGQIAAERNWTLTRLTTADWDMETIFLRLTSEQRQDASAAS